MMNAKGCSDGRQTVKTFLLSGYLATCFDIMNRLNEKMPWQKGVSMLFFIGFLCLFAQCFSTRAVAADWLVIPKIKAGGGYEENIFFDSDNKVSSSVLLVEPGLQVDYNTLLSSIQLTARVYFIDYLDETDLNRVNQYYRLDGNHRLGERWETRTILRFTDDTTLNTYLAETGRVIQRVGRQWGYALGGISYDINHLSAIDTDYSYERAKYEGEIYPDYTRQRLNLRYRQRLKSGQDEISIGPSFYNRRNDVNDTNYASLDFGWERDWSAITNTFAAIGARYAKVKNNLGNDEENWGTRARFDLTRKGLASTTTFRYYHDLATTADGQDVNVDNFYLRYNYSLSARFSLGIRGRLVFSYNLYSDQNDAPDARYFNLEPFLSYRLAENTNLYFRYRYQNAADGIIDTENVRGRNTAWIEIRYELPTHL